MVCQGTDNAMTEALETLLKEVPDVTMRRKPKKK